MTILKNIKENKGRVALASLLIVSVLVLGGLYLLTNQTKGAAHTSLKDVLSTSAPGTAADHTITFSMQAGNNWAAGETLTLTFDTGFVLTTLANTDPLDYDIKTDTGGTPVDEAIVAAGGCASNDAIEITSIVGQVITFTACGSYTAPGNGKTYEIQIGLNALQGGDGNSQITNPGKSAGVGTADIKTVGLAGTIGANDVGTALVAIIEGIAVSVTVDESLSFSIVGVTNNACDTSFSTLGGPDTVTTDAAVPFATLTPGSGVFTHACHDLTISTNAPSGYSITAVENNSLLRTGVDANDKTLDDTLCGASACDKDTEQTWSDATAYPGFGYSCVLSGASPNKCVITANTKYKTFACAGADGVCDPSTGVQASVNVATSTVPVNNKVSRIEYKISVAGDQPAGAYSNIITYVATPTF